MQMVARNGNAEGDYTRLVELLAATPPVYLRDLGIVALGIRKT